MKWKRNREGHLYTSPPFFVCNFRQCLITFRIQKKNPYANSLRNKKN